MSVPAHEPLTTRPRLSPHIVNRWPRPEGAPVDWLRWDAAERADWLLDRAFVEHDGAWVPSTDPADAAIRDRVLEAIAVQQGGALVADELYSAIAGSDDDESSSQLTRHGPSSPSGRRTLAGLAVAILLLLIVVALVATWVRSDDEGTSDAVTGVPPAEQTASETVDGAVDVADAVGTDVDGSDSSDGGAGVSEQGDTGGPTPSTVPGHDDYVGIWTDGEVGLELSADGTYKMVSPDAYAEGWYRLVVDDFGQIRVQFLEEPDALYFGMAAPLDLRSDALWFGHADHGQLLPRGTILPDRPATARPFTVDVGEATELRGAWRSLHPQIEVGPGGRSGHLLLAESGNGMLYGDPDEGELTGMMTFTYRDEIPEGRGSYATGSITVTIVSSESGRENRGPTITGTADVELTLDGWTNCAEGTCATGYTSSATGPYTMILDGGTVRFELPRFNEPGIPGDADGGTTFELTLRFVAPSS